MFNVTVLKMKDIVKFLIIVVILIFLIIFFKKNVSFNKIDDKSVKCLGEIIPKIDSTEESLGKVNYLKSFLKTEISYLEEIDTVENRNEENEIETKQINNIAKENNLEVAKTSGITTEVVTPNPIKESYNVEYGSVKIKNETTYQLTDDILNPNITIDNKNVLIFHTHSCESYTSSEQFSYTPTRKLQVY